MIDKKDIILPDMEDETRDYIDKVLDYLIKTGKLNVIDNGALYMLADTYNTYIKASKLLKEEGLISISDRGNKNIHPAYNIMKSSIAQAVVILRDFGLSLYSRGKLKVIDEGEKSPLEDFLGIK